LLNCSWNTPLICPSPLWDPCERTLCIMSLIQHDNLFTKPPSWKNFWSTKRTSFQRFDSNNSLQNSKWFLITRKLISTRDLGRKHHLPRSLEKTKWCPWISQRNISKEMDWFSWKALRIFTWGDELCIHFQGNRFVFSRIVIWGNGLVSLGFH